MKIIFRTQFVLLQFLKELVGDFGDWQIKQRGKYWHW